MSAWRHGTKRDHDVLTVRDRWQGLFGPNAWLQVLLALGAGITAPTGTVPFLAAMALIALLFHTVVRYVTDVIRWRNRFFWKHLPTGDVGYLTIDNTNTRSWVPTVTAEVRPDSSRRWWPSRFVATFSYRRAVAETVASEIDRWAALRSIEHDLRPEYLTWRLSEPKGWREAQAARRAQAAPET